MKTYKEIAGDGGSKIVEQVTEQKNRLQSRLSKIKNIIAVMSGKGGVGKSSVTVNLASALALAKFSTGIMDADINGPSITKMTGVRGNSLESGETGIIPPLSTFGIKIMSIDLFLPQENTPVMWNAFTQKDAFTWRGIAETGALRELLSDTEWGELDFLLVDLPPGTDKLPNLVDLIPHLTGTIIVTIPSGVSQFVVGKSIRMATEVLKTPVIGLIENMSTYVCSHCGQEESLFPTGQVEKMAKDNNLPFLGKIPFDPRIAMSADSGKSFMEKHAELPAGKEIQGICDKVIQWARVYGEMK
jgi:ATP-binding protein involved in chromosome partitioning